MEINQSVIILKERVMLYPKPDMQEIRKQIESDIAKGYLIVPIELQYVGAINIVGEPGHITIQIADENCKKIL